jgi:exopolyphosphatase/guanosine-5'-triphosphate,3'-diphosphate pyrophosphatase
MTDPIKSNIANQITSQIIPRWEWRTFGENFTETENILATMECSRVKVSEEIYILSKNSCENCKIRNSLMDIKMLQQVDENGLELWKPVLKASFPLSFEIVRLVLRTLHIRKPLLLRSQYTHYQFLTDIIRPHPKLNVVDIKKKRHGYLIDGAEVEIAELQIGAKHIKTVAIESDNTACVMKVRDQLKVRELPNVNYIKVLKKISGF